MLEEHEVDVKSYTLCWFSYLGNMRNSLPLSISSKAKSLCFYRMVYIEVQRYNSMEMTSGLVGREKE